MITRTTIEIELGEAIAGEDQDRILMIPWTPPIALSTPRDHPARRRSIIHDATDENQSARDSHRRASRRPSVAGRTDDGCRSNHRGARCARGQDRALGPHDSVARLPFSDPCEGGDGRTSAPRLWGQAPDGPSDGVVGPMVVARPEGVSPSLIDQKRLPCLIKIKSRQMPPTLRPSEPAVDSVAGASDGSRPTGLWETEFRGMETRSGTVR